MLKLKAKVFISCGQTKDSDEERIANEVATMLDKEGFEPYVAVQQQSLKGLKENIINELSSSEYFLFIDFKRERLVGSEGILKQLFKRRELIRRGSLFSHQELAIASFLDLRLLGFQENGVKKDDGIIKFLQTNCIPFSDRRNLVDVIFSKIKQFEWKPNWKNQLIMERDPYHSTEAIWRPTDELTRFFHIKIRNRNPYTHAFNCYVYLKNILDVQTGNRIYLETVELKWAGYIFPNATILADSFRNLDAFYIFMKNHISIKFSSPFSDYSLAFPPIDKVGDYDLTYCVVSENFRICETTFRLHLSANINETTLSKISERDLPLVHDQTEEKKDSGTSNVPQGCTGPATASPQNDRGESGIGFSHLAQGQTEEKKDSEITADESKGWTGPAAPPQKDRVESGIRVIDPEGK